MVRVVEARRQHRSGTAITPSSRISRGGPAHAYNDRIAVNLDAEPIENPETAF
jgi:hypothetical protein